MITFVRQNLGIVVTLVSLPCPNGLTIIKNICIHQ
jgi:hypothetical protein